MNSSPQATPPPNSSDSLAETLEDLFRATGEQLSGFEREFDAQMKNATRFVRANPVTSVVGAAILGYLVARLFAKSKTVYVERDRA